MPIKTVGQAMHEFKNHSLHSGKGGPVVTSRAQAEAIGLSSERRARHKKSSPRRHKSMGLREAYGGRKS